MRLGWIVAVLLMTGAALAQEPGNMGGLPARAEAPFRLERVVPLTLPWAIAPLPGGDLLVTGKGGRLWQVSHGQAEEIRGLPAVRYEGQIGLLDIAAAPDFVTTRRVFLSYVAEDNALTLARARLAGNRLTELTPLWRQSPGGEGQPGGIIAFGPDGMVYLSVGDRMQPDTAQQPDNPRGKILRLTPEGQPAPGNPFTGSPTRAATWSEGHRNPYGLAFAPDGTLWEHEMGPRGGDELNRIEPGRNYGWPLVSNGDHYSGWPIPDHYTRPDLAAPVLWWTPVIAPAGLAVYAGHDFPDWTGSLLIGALRGEGLVRVAPDGTSQLDRWDLGMRVRDVAVDGAGHVWIISDAEEGALYRLVPLSE
ncbi:PQQ-dependent sugar dehydrogenase [Paenirhodobacter hankyongi]|uniref:PQQ-dependent sugar dehydrogenase n=1 Tax=Paenirhodobacter hankyongi TaxID=2294033 RepID=A0A421BPV6_9RHOB|nr:PQQ-dependent sugar dehydrogenase [Sinirhodobacter hankyongi]RLL65113.1 PQQ-dependent sugar dehydrogenase [Sinirhodobacter hankyongi]